MKNILLLAAVVLFTACGKNKTYVQRPNDTGSTTSTSNNGSAASSFSSTLTATKSYSPAQYQDGVFIMDETYNVRVPSYITVTQGSAGNHKAEIHFDGLICIYKGGSSMSNPIYTGNSTEISLGKKYNFSHCESAQGVNAGVQVGDYVSVMNTVTLAVKNGDSQALTVIQVNLSFVK